MSTLSTVAIQLADFLRNEILIPFGEMSSDRKLALDILDKWDVHDLKTPFQVNIAQLKIRLKKLVENPTLLNQGPFGICATEVFLYVILKDYPGKFVRYAIDMIESGSAHIGNLYIKTSTAFRNAKFELALNAEMVSKGMDVCDILLIGAIRDSTNKLYSYDLTKDNWLMEFFDSKSHSANNEDLDIWFNETKLYKPLTFIENKNLSIADSINLSCKNNETILVMIYTAGNMQKPLEFTNDKGKHICALYINKIIKIPPDKCSISLVSWGKTIVQNMTEKGLKECVLGYFEVNSKG
ncbi:MAG: hypothetical protein IT257_04550 [Chitinophagaceae bacterium]|nr:hypothetical protein [Chitinophagaceae bacterium]